MVSLYTWAPAVQTLVGIGNRGLPWCDQCQKEARECISPSESGRLTHLVLKPGLGEKIDR